MSRTVEFTLPEEDYVLFRAEAERKRMPMAVLARGAVMAEVRKNVGRTDVISALENRVEALVRRVCREEIGNLLSEAGKRADGTLRTRASDSKVL